IRARRLVPVGLAVPVTTEAEHAHMHFPASANDWHVRRRLTIDERTTPFNDRLLALDRQVVDQVKCTGSELHTRTLSFPFEHADESRSHWYAAGTSVQLDETPAQSRQTAALST